MDFLALTTIVATSSNLILGYFVFVKNTRSRTHQLFGLFCLFVATWSVANYLALIITDKDVILFWIRMVMAFATAQSVTLLLFILTFPNHFFSIPKKLLIIIISAGFITFLVSLLPYVFADIELSSDGKVLRSIAAPGMLLFIIVAVGAVIASIFLSVKKLLRSSGLIKIQFQYIFVSLVLMYSGIIFFSFIHPVFFQNSSYVYLSSLFTLPFIVLTAYAMLRYRLLNIRVVIRKGAIYGIALVTALAIYTYLALILKSTIENSWNISPGLTAAILIALIALGFPPLKSLVERSINTLFKGKQSIDLAVKEVREQIAKKTDFEELVDIVTRQVRQYLEVGEVKLYILNYQEQKYVFTGERGVKEELELGNDIASYAIKHSDALVRDEIPHLAEKEDVGVDKKFLPGIEKEMKKRSVSIILPLKTEDELFGILMLGERSDKSAFTVQDIQYLDSLREEVGFTLASAFQYKNAMERIMSNAGHSERASVSEESLRRL